MEETERFSHLVELYDYEFISKNQRSFKIRSLIYSGLGYDYLIQRNLGGLGWTRKPCSIILLSDLRSYNSGLRLDIRDREEFKMKFLSSLSLTHKDEFVSKGYKDRVLKVLSIGLDCMNVSSTLDNLYFHHDVNLVVLKD